MSTPYTGYSPAEIDRRCMLLGERERERTGRGHVTVRFVTPREGLEKRDPRKRPNKSYGRSKKTQETAAEREAREKRQAAVARELAKRERAA